MKNSPKNSPRMKRCYYISNSYDGAYFVLTDNIEEYFQRMSSYLLNLENSQKCNHYSFGSVEMTAAEYEQNRTSASNLEKARIAEKTQTEEVEPELEEFEIELKDYMENADDDFFEEPTIPAPPTPKKGERPHLRLV